MMRKGSGINGLFNDVLLILGRPWMYQFLESVYPIVGELILLKIVLTRLCEVEYRKSIFIFRPLEEQYYIRYIY